MRRAVAGLAFADERAYLEAQWNRRLVDAPLRGTGRPRGKVAEASEQQLLDLNLITEIFNPRCSELVAGAASAGGCRSISSPPC
jgi:hypothetical protein